MGYGQIKDNIIHFYPHTMVGGPYSYNGGNLASRINPEKRNGGQSRRVLSTMLLSVSDLVCLQNSSLNFICQLCWLLNSLLSSKDISQSPTQCFESRENVSLNFFLDLILREQELSLQITSLSYQGVKMDSVCVGIDVCVDMDVDVFNFGFSV